MFKLCYLIQYMDEVRIGFFNNNECRQGFCWYVFYLDDNCLYSSFMCKYILVYYLRGDGIYVLEI